MEHPPVGSTTPTNFLRARLAGTGELASNGGALILNVLASGVGGFVFWIVAARSVSTQTVAEATALVTTMFGVLQISQQTLIANLPTLVAAAPHPRGMAARAYAVSATLTGITAVIYIAIGPEVADGLRYLRDGRLATIFLVGCLIWSIFSMQDALLTGLRRGNLVLAENTAWGLARLVLLVLIPVIGIRLTVESIVATWLIPAVVLVGVVNRYLFVVPHAPLRQPLGNHRFDRRWLYTHLGFEQVSALIAGATRIALPAVVLTTLTSDEAAPFMAALSFILVSEGAMSSFTSAFAVEMRRAGGASRQLVTLTIAFLVAFSSVAIVTTQLFGDQFMALFGSEYRFSGGAALAILALGLPPRIVSMLSTSVNRVYGAGWRSLAQGLAYTAALFIALTVLRLDSASNIAWALVIARYAAGIVAVRHIVYYLVRRPDIPGAR